MTGAPDPDSRYTVLPDALRHQRRAGVSMTDIQIARAEAYVARLETALVSDAPGLTAPARKRTQRTLREWRAHLAKLRAEASNAAAFRHAAE